MIFRDRGRAIQVVRPAIDPATGRKSAEVVARLTWPDLSLIEDEANALTPEENAEIEAYRARVIRQNRVDQAHAAAHFPQTLDLVTQWLSTADADEAGHFLDEIQKPLRALRRELTRVETER